MQEVPSKPRNQATAVRDAFRASGSHGGDRESATRGREIQLMAPEEQQDLDRQHRLAGKRIIEEQARRQLRTFLDELKNGTTNYRTVASLGDEVAREYRGRAVLELLQNAHDVLGRVGGDDRRQVSFVLNTSPEQPELLIANSGRPFLDADFSGICRLAQSPKDPNKSVGNKGLGFRSVLELTTRPEVWSTAPAGGEIAFTFGFDPDVLEPIARVATRLFDRDAATDPAFGPKQVVDWPERQIEEYRRRQIEEARRRVSRNGIKPEEVERHLTEEEVKNYLTEEVTKYLSPYVLPRFLGDPPDQVARLLADGHVTVIRLPLDGGKAGRLDEEAKREAVKSVRDQLRTLDEAANMVFLHHLSVLRITIEGECVELTRSVEPELPFPAPAAWRERVRVGRAGPEAADANERSFHVWSRTVGGDDHPDEKKQIKDAVVRLPNRWPEVRTVEVALAVEETRKAPPGRYVIFLPTETETTVGAHVNAPFYGSLDRRHIDFEDAYNKLLLECVTKLMCNAVEVLVAGDPEPWRGRAVIDLLAPVPGTPEAKKGPPLTSTLRELRFANERPLDDQGLILCDGAWRQPGVARTMPNIPPDDPFGEAEWRAQAGFAVVCSTLDERRDAVEALLRVLDGSPDPKEGEWTDTLARMAGWVSDSQPTPTWNDFLRSAFAILPRKLLSEPTESGADPLRTARFLPTEDGELRSASDAVRIFFQPRRNDDAADFVGSVPVSLQQRIAFLHHDVQTHEGPQRRRTEVQKFLDGRFVQSFRREDLLREVVIPSLPELPAAHGSPEAARCADALAWTLEVIGEEEPEGLLDRLADLPVACTDGWLPIREAVFGPGWDGRSGEHLRALADALPDEEGAEFLGNALLSPGDDRWFPQGDRRDTDGHHPRGIELASRADLFDRAGVVEGLRLEVYKPIRFEMSRANPELPDMAPVGVPQPAWDDWREAARKEVKPHWVGPFEYRLEGVTALPILHREHLGDPARTALWNLILASLAHWKNGWEEVTIKRKWWAAQVTSPVKHWLSTLPWLVDRSGKEHPPQQEPRPLSQRWLVPTSLLRGPKGHFRHLSPLPPALAHRLAEDEELLGALKGLGLNVYPTEEDDRTGPVLLDALAGVVQPLVPDGNRNHGKDLADGVEAHDAMPTGGFDVLLGQVRHAWSHLDPAEGLPNRILVRTRPYRLEVRSAANIGDAYLPDDAAHTRSLREHHQPIFAMWPKEARGDIGDLLHEKGARRASELKVQCLVDRRLPADRAEEAQAIEVGLEWLPVVLLSLAAYGGNNPRGPATGTWLKARERLQRARVLLCGSIEVELLDANGESVARSEPDAYWMPQDDRAVAGGLGTAGTLLLSRDVAAFGQYDRIGPAAQAMLERQDLLKDLRLVLGSLVGHPQPTDRQVEEALGRAEIDGFDVANIRRQCGIRVLRDRIRPVLKLLDVSDDGLDEAKDASGLTEWLSKNARIPKWPAEDLMAAARECYDDFEMGFRVLGDDVELPEWNEALEALGGEYTPVENEHAADQTTGHLMRAARWLSAFARHVANESPGVTDPARLFSDIRAVHEDFVMDPRWSRRWWTVPFRAVLGALRDRYEGIPETQEHLGAFAGADGSKEFGPREFREALKGQGVALEPDPLDVAHRNERRVRRVFRRMWRVYQAWLAEQGGDRERIDQAPSVDLDAARYLREWSEVEAFEQAKRLIDNEGFLEVTDGYTTIEAIRKRLGVSPEDYDRGGPPQREPDPVIIAGKKFGEGDSIPELFEHLDRMDIGRVVVLTGIDPSEPTDPPVVVRPPPVTPLSKDPPLVRVADRGPIVHPPRHLPELVGIVGEMQAYRYLKSAFGINKYGWVAQFRTKVFPLGRDEKDTTDDRLGYDFEFLHPDGKIWCVEVKSTTRDGTSFDVTAGELAAASRLAGSKAKRWRFLRVRRAFSSQPEFDWLPNPFESGAGQRLQLLQGSMTVEYALSKNSEDDRSAESTPQSEPEDQ